MTPRSIKHVWLSVIGVVCVIVLITPPPSVMSQGSERDYARWSSYASRTSNRVFKDSVKPNWFGRQNDKFWYRVKTGIDSHQFILVDAIAKTRIAAFDHEALAAELSDEVGEKVESSRLDIKSLTFDPDLRRCRFRFDNRRWSFRLPAGPLTATDNDGPSDSSERIVGLKPLERITRSKSGGDRSPIQFENRLDRALKIFWVDPSGNRVPYGQVAAGGSWGSDSFVDHAWVLVDANKNTVAAFVVDPWSETAIIDKDTIKPEPQQRFDQRRRSGGGNRSPDGNWSVSFADHNVVLSDRDDALARNMTDDGDKNNTYGGRVWWSPDSQHFVVMKKHDVAQREIVLVDSAPDDSIHSKTKTVTYVKPGDELDISRPTLFHIDLDEPVKIDDTLFANPFDITDVAWHADSKSFSFVYNERGHQVLRFVAVNAESGEPKAIVDETSETFVCYSQKKFLHRIDQSNELIWMSERSGWNHLYLIDSQTGEVKNAITSGEWVVREVERVDDDNRQLWLKVSGIDPTQDPYHVHLIRIDFDGSNLVQLTDGDGTHQWQFSPDQQFLIDNYSRVDLPPRTELRQCATGNLLCALETADVSSLLDTPWQFPERFVAKGRDGKTDIHGIIVRPTNFDAGKRYPVLEDIYAGPHSAFVPKRFGRHQSMYEMAELGFIVVKIDGMGTSHRSKAFHDVCWLNLGDSGFPDRIAWMKAAAKGRPEMDLSRVGIWGGSAGGQSAMRALIAHNDFYHVAVADCGCHDNRVDKIWWNEQWMGWPIGPHYAEQSNVTQAHQLQGDLLLIWGELDNNVDPASTTQVIDALVKADKDFEQLIMPGVGHGAAGHPYAKRRQADFFVRKLWHREPRHKTPSKHEIDR